MIEEQNFSQNDISVTDKKKAMSTSPISLNKKPIGDTAAGHEPLHKSLDSGLLYLAGQQSEDGHWRFDLEADVTIPAEYILLQKFFENEKPERERKIVRYLKNRQLKDGSWPLYFGGSGNISATVKAYFALKLAGESIDGPELKKARCWVLENGGAESVNVFTRITLAIFGQIPWRTVPAMPVEIMFLPKWWFFSLSKVSYWSRCVIVPLLIIFAKKPLVRVDEEKGVYELFGSNPNELKNLDQIDFHEPIKSFFVLLDRLIKRVEPLIPNKVREKAINLAETWLRAHSKGEGGVGAIFPAIANAAIAYKLLGSHEDDQDFVRQLNAVEKLVIDGFEESFCQPCVSPVWDTCLSLSALAEGGAHPEHPAVRKAVDWLVKHQIFVDGDWKDKAPQLRAGGWAFQYENDKYPDVDDTGMVLMSLLRVRAHCDHNLRKKMLQALKWVVGMQNADGSWGAFDIGNNAAYLNNIPFADHGALIDPGTADVTARSVELLCMLGYSKHNEIVKNALNFLKADQESDGSWYGRWGVNYLYGTWSVLSALGAAREDPAQPYIRKAIKWLKTNQNIDGGWGESCDSYEEKNLSAEGESTASQTAWAMLGLIAVGEGLSPEVERGAAFLEETQSVDGDWEESEYTGTGFPKVFYLRYHGYAKYFPVWALAAYRRELAGLQSRQKEIMADGNIELGFLDDLKFAS